MRADPRALRVFVFSVEDETGREADSGFVRAETPEAALALIGHPDAVVVHLPADAEWPGEPSEQIHSVR